MTEENNIQVEQIIIPQLKKIKRDDLGLIEGIEYKFTNEGMVDWRRMIPSQFLYVNNDLKKKVKIEKKYGKPYDQIDPIKDNVEETDLVQLLGATKFLLRLRGFIEVNSTIKESSEQYASVNCSIKFTPNFESEGQVQTYSENACAHQNNTNSFTRWYLVEMATNRALCRCVRNYLGINIVSKEELGASMEDTNFSPTANSFAGTDRQDTLLLDIMEKKKVLFDPHIVDKLKKENKYKIEYKSVSDLPADIKFDLINRLKQLKLE